MKTIKLSKTIPAEYCGMRIDAALSLLLPDYSRAQISKWIKQEEITIDGELVKTKYKVKGHELINLDCTLKHETELVPQAGDLDIVFEDDELLILNKQANWVVHPGAGNPDHTVVNALLYYNDTLSLLPRAGIIHRLDKDTTGLLIVAKTLTSYNHLVRMMQNREINRHYYALVYGEINDNQTINAPIGRHPTQRTKMSVSNKGKPAVTHFDILEFYNQLTLLDVKLDTGRTHQIRVHLTHIGHPLVGDQTYINKNLQQAIENQLPYSLQSLQRQALHAYKLEFAHPTKDNMISLKIDLATDFQKLLELIEDHE